MNRRPYKKYAIYRDGKSEFPGGHIEIMIFIEIETLEFYSLAAILKLCDL